MQLDSHLRPSSGAASTRDKTPAARARGAHVSLLAGAKAAIVGFLAASSPAAGAARRLDPHAALRPPGRALQGTVTINCNDGSGSTTYNTVGATSVSYDVPCTNGIPVQSGGAGGNSPPAPSGDAGGNSPPAPSGDDGGSPPSGTTVGYGRRRTSR